MQTEEEMGTQHLAMDRPGVRQIPEGSVGSLEQRKKMEGTDCEVICVLQRPSRLRDR